MIIESAKYFPFSIKLKKPFQNSRFTITHRKGFYLEIKTSDNKILFGEASPLPGFSKEDVYTVEFELNQFTNFATGANQLDKISIYNWIKENRISPSTAFAIEQAIFNYSEFQPIGNIEINALIGFSTVDNILSMVNRFTSEGYNTIKIKCGIDPFDEELKKISLVREKYPNLKIRIDANGKWDYDEASSNITKLENFNIEYIEQPVSSLDELKNLSEKISIPLAADESIKNYEIANELLNDTSLILVIKPMTVGFNNTIKLIKNANDKNKKLVISSLFESSVGRSANIYLASLVKYKTAHGLGTDEFLECEVYNDPFKIISGKIDIGAENIPTKFQV